MKKQILSIAPVVALTTVCQVVSAQNTTTREEVGADGRTYRVTENRWQQSVPYTEYETREQRVYRPQAATDYQPFQQTYAVPVTEYRWVSRMRGFWNPFSQPYWTHQLEPFTRYDYQTATVQLPVTRTTLVEETRTVQVPVTRYRTVENTSTSRVAIREPSSTSTPNSIGGPSGAPQVATRPPSSGRYGSERITKDPPSAPSRLAGQSGTLSPLIR